MNPFEGNTTAEVPPGDGVAALADEQGPIPTFPPRAFGPDGRLIPLTAEQRKARSEAARRAIDAIARITDETDTDGRWREIYRNIDAGRPHRPLFEGLY
jgi:hypothetical protein